MASHLPTCPQQCAAQNMGSVGMGAVLFMSVSPPVPLMLLELVGGSMGNGAKMSGQGQGAQHVKG